MFCPECESVIVPKDGNLVCLDCDYKSTDQEKLDDYIIKEELDPKVKSRIEIISQPFEEIGITKEIREELREQYREAISNASD